MKGKRRAAVLSILIAAATAVSMVPFGSVPATAATTITDCSGVQVRPGDDIQALLNANPEGTTFCLAPGEYRLTTALTPKNNQRIIGLGTQEARLTGAKVVTAAPAGAYFVISGQTTLGTSSLSGLDDPAKQCRRISSDRDPGLMCVQRDQVFLNDVSLWQVDSLSKVVPGTFFWDYATNRIYLRDNPSGRKLEVSVAGAAAIRDGGISGVTVQNVVIEKFGNPASSGALQGGQNWTVLDNLITNNHGAGLHVEPGMVARGNTITRNGELGIHGGGSGAPIIVENNEISFNNTAAYSWTWEAGGMKFVRTDGLQFRNNVVNNNYGPGVWLDIDNVKVLVEGNTVTNNISTGIYHEIGGSAVIRNNTARGNGTQELVQNRVFGAGILIGESFDVEVYGNIVEGNRAGITAVQRNRGFGPLGPREVRNLYVHDNRVQQSAGLAAGLQVLDNMGDSAYTIKRNRWENNTYTLGSISGQHFMWYSTMIPLSRWRSYGHDDGRI